MSTENLVIIEADEHIHCPKIPLIEQETVISFNPAEDEAYVWTLYPRVWDWLEEIGVTPYDDMPELKQYRLSRHWIEIRPKSVKKAFKTSKRFVA
ncbi:hypothetical protein MYX76_06170 [Desulfobacterota bacterium AH_259_B03_O07]|nr:hypothetical protein [Desulfobacterota bacterium AH_259_B03_O07]